MTATTIHDITVVSGTTSLMISGRATKAAERPAAGHILQDF